MTIEKRVERIERKLGMDDEIVEFDLGDESVTMTAREFDQILREVMGTRILPGNTARARLPTAEAEGLTDDDGI